LSEYRIAKIRRVTGLSVIRIIRPYTKPRGWKLLMTHCYVINRLNCYSAVYFLNARTEMQKLRLISWAVMYGKLMVSCWTRRDQSTGCSLIHLDQVFAKTSWNVAYDNKEPRLALKHKPSAVYESSPGHCADEVSTNPGYNCMSSKHSKPHIEVSWRCGKLSAAARHQKSLKNADLGTGSTYRTDASPTKILRAIVTNNSSYGYVRGSQPFCSRLSLASFVT